MPKKLSLTRPQLHPTLCGTGSHDAYRLPIRVMSRMFAERHTPRDQEVCVSITNPRQSSAVLEGWADILRLGFHDTNGPGGNFKPMSLAEAIAVIRFCRLHKDDALTVHCEFGASRSVGIGLFIAVWLRRPLALDNVSVLLPNPWVVRQLRVAALCLAWKLGDWRLLRIGLTGPIKHRYTVLPEKIADTYPDHG